LTNKTNEQATEKREQATIDEKIESLQTMRTTLISKRVAVEKQLRDLEARMEEKKRKGLISGTADQQNPDGQQGSNGG
jgi:hypothetical protein